LTYFDNLVIYLNTPSIFTILNNHAHISRVFNFLMRTGFYNSLILTMFGAA